jgi:hypothetical protein
MSFLTYNKTSKAFDIYGQITDFSKPYIYYFRASPFDPYLFRSNAYLNGTEVFSDTIKFQFVRPSTTSINQVKRDNPRFRIYPNPSVDQVRIAANEPVNENLNIKIMDIKGSTIRLISSHGVSRLNESILWDGRTSLGKRAESGIYIIQIDGITIHEKLKVILK